MVFGRPSEAVFSLSGAARVGSVTPVTAHPLGEVSVVVLVVVRGERRQQPERHGEAVQEVPAEQGCFTCAPGSVVQKTAGLS